MFVVSREGPEELVFRCVVAHTGKVFAVLRRCFPAPGIADLSLRHQVTFIAAVGKYLGRPVDSVRGSNGDQMVALEFHAVLLAYSLVKTNLDPGPFQHGAKDLFIHMWFGEPVGRTV